MLSVIMQGLRFKGTGVGLYRFPGLVDLSDTEVLQRNNPTRFFILHKHIHTYTDKAQHKHITHSVQEWLYKYDNADGIGSKRSEKDNQPSHIVYNDESGSYSS